MDKENFPSKWAGYIFGTNTGKIFVKFNNPNREKLLGILSINDTSLGVSQYSLEGRYDGNLLILEGTPKNIPNIEETKKVIIGNIKINGELDSKGNLKGDWQSNIGTMGTFTAFPHGENEPSLTDQFYKYNRKLDVLHLNKDSILHIINAIKKELPESKLIITYEISGKEISIYDNNFQSHESDIIKSKILKFYSSDKDRNVNKSIIVSLGAFGENTITTESSDEQWAVYFITKMEEVFKKQELKSFSFYKKYGTWINSFFFMYILIELPEITSTLNRVVFVILSFLILLILKTLHNRFALPMRISVSSVKRDKIIEKNILFHIGTQVFISVLGGIALHYLLLYI